MNQTQVKMALAEADRKRAKIAYRGIERARTEAAEQRIINRNRMTPEYQEADNEFRRLSDLLKEMNALLDGPTELKKLFRVS